MKQLSLPTTKLQAIIANAIKGAGEDKMVLLTNLMCIQVKDNKLTVITTDGVNYTYVMDNVESEDFYAVVPVSTFSKLISRLTCDDVAILVDSDKMTVRGNGRYAIELPLNEEGEPIVFPDPMQKFNMNAVDTTIPAGVIQQILKTAKASLSVDLDTPCYCGYYMGKNIVATDTSKICGINIATFDSPVLLNASTVDILGIIPEESVDVYRNGKKLLFKADKFAVHTEIMDGMQDYQIDTLNSFLDDSYDNFGVIKKADLLQLLNRLSLFVGVYDDDCIRLTFSKNGLLISSKQADSSEQLSWIVYNSTSSDFTCCINIKMFLSQVKASAGDTIEIQFGKENAIKMVDGNITQVLALEDDSN